MRKENVEAEHPRHIPDLPSSSSSSSSLTIVELALPLNLAVSLPSLSLVLPLLLDATTGTSFGPVKLRPERLGKLNRFLCWLLEGFIPVPAPDPPVLVPASSKEAILEKACGEFYLNCEAAPDERTWPQRGLLP
jgi:hypothetical protein